MIVRMIRRYGVMGNDGPSGRTLQSMAKQSKKSVQYGLIKRVQVNNQITLASVYLGVCRHMIALTKASFDVVLSSSRLVVLSYLWIVLISLKSSPLSRLTFLLISSLISHLFAGASLVTPSPLSKLAGNGTSTKVGPVSRTGFANLVIVR